MSAKKIGGVCFNDLNHFSEKIKKGLERTIFFLEKNGKRNPLSLRKNSLNSLGVNTCSSSMCQAKASSPKDWYNWFDEVLRQNSGSAGCVGL